MELPQPVADDASHEGRPEAIAEACQVWCQKQQPVESVGFRCAGWVDRYCGSSQPVIAFTEQHMQSLGLKGQHCISVGA